MKLTSLKAVLQGTTIDPKVARRKLRANFGGSHEKGTSWMFDTRGVTKARKLLGIVATTRKARKTKDAPAPTVPATV